MFPFKKRQAKTHALDGARSVLENHHCCRAFQLMLHAEIQLVSHFDNADYISFRAVVLQNILATDMARHGVCMCIDQYSYPVCMCID